MSRRVVDYLSSLDLNNLNGWNQSLFAIGAASSLLRPWRQVSKNSANISFQPRKFVTNKRRKSANRNWKKKKNQQKLKKRYISVVLSENVSFLSWLLWMLHRIEMATFAGDCGQCVSSRGVWREEKQNRLLDLELIIGIRWKLHWERGRCSSLQNNPTSIWYKKENPKLKEREREREREKRDKRTNNNIFRVWSWIYFLPVSSTRSSRKMATRNGTGNHPPKINNNNIDNDINWC